MASFFPTVASWYQELATAALFEVVAIDEKTGNIEVQYDDGDIAEYDPESWRQLDLVPAAAPEDANAGYGAPSITDDEYDAYTASDAYANPLESIEPESFHGFDDLF